MAKPAPPKDPVFEAALPHYERLVATIPSLERKGAANPYTSINGHMTSYLHPNGSMALRLPAGVREDFLAKHNTTLFDAYGRVQKEYVRVPGALLTDTEALAPYFAESIAYVGAMKPKPTTRKS